MHHLGNIYSLLHNRHSLCLPIIVYIYHMKQLLKLFTLALFTLIYTNGYSQKTEEIQLAVGDTLQFSKCSGGNYLYMDIYTKTRFEPNDDTFNVETGEGFYHYFFATGDFDATKLPCSYSGQKVTIVAFQDVEDNETHEIRSIILVKLAEHTVVWIEFLPAYNNDEVIIVPKS